MHQLPLWAKILVTITLQAQKNQRQWSVNDFWSCILGNPRAKEQRYSIINLSAAFMGKNATDNITSALYN